MNISDNKIYFVTGNPHKFKEVSKFFQGKELNYQLKHSTLETVEIQADTLEEIVRFKLESVKEEINDSFFVEDAGFFIDSPLKGFPGPYSSYVFNTIGNQGILKLITDFNETRAHFEAVIALYLKPFNKISIFKGLALGRLSEVIKGERGFGFDPIFIPNEYPDKTFAELTASEKNKISHRGRAIKKLFQVLKSAKI
ncbi:MAG: XTP/dITP diphosphatase [Candidatus Lokiarchaeota archaeon]|nr:XTP/dITP diphosphatase [Candidatus Lokiarchaeota archaeon]MBD3342217.1 XTP/dITP diphosphatase [Candidatus Lokiarchaeota archaeon]